MAPVPKFELELSASDALQQMRGAINRWIELAVEHARAAEEYRATWSKLYVASTEKNADGKKNDADSKTSDLRLARDLAEIRAGAAYHEMIFLRGGAES